MAEFPVDPMLAKMIIQSEKYGVSGEFCGGWGAADLALSWHLGGRYLAGRASCWGPLCPGRTARQH
jgi:hypothetical protein